MMEFRHSSLSGCVATKIDHGDSSVIFIKTHSRDCYEYSVYSI